MSRSSTVVASTTKQAERCGQRYSYNSRIFNGERAKETDWPWMAFIESKSNGRESRCGGAFISQSWVMTAQHCLERNAFGTIVQFDQADITVTAGMTALGESYGATQGLLIRPYRVLKIIRHPGYDRATHQYDFALLQVKSSEDSSRHFQPRPICLTSCKALSDGQMCQVAGYGLTSYRGNLSNDLQQADLPIVPDQACKSTYAQYGIKIDPASMVCAGYQNGEKDSCTFDSGGPLVCHNGQSRNFHLAGIVSFGYQCGQTYGVYARVSTVTQWVRSEMGSQLPSMPCSRGSTVNSACDCVSIILGKMTFYRTDLPAKHGHATYRDESTNRYLIPFRSNMYNGWIISSNSKWSGWNDFFDYIAIKKSPITCPHHYNGQFYKRQNSSYEKVTDTIRCDQSPRPVIMPQVSDGQRIGSTCCKKIIITGHGQRHLSDPIYLTPHTSPGSYINYETGYTIAYNTRFKLWIFGKSLLNIACYMSAPTQKSLCPSKVSGLFACYVDGWRFQYYFRISCA